MAIQQPVLEVMDLHFNYNGLLAVTGARFSVARGEICALIGGNGAGKSTAVKCIAGALRPHSGKVIFEGQDVTGLPSHKVVDLGIALVPEGRLVFQHLTVRENLVLAGRVKRARDKMGENLDRVFSLFPRLEERQSQPAGLLSGGEQQMLAICRGMMTSPKLLILDEPSLGLSPLFVSNIFALVQKLNDEGITILIVEQNVHQTLALAGQGHVLEKGKVVQSGRGSELLKDPRVIEAYLGLTG